MLNIVCTVHQRNVLSMVCYNVSMKTNNQLQPPREYSRIFVRSTKHTHKDTLARKQHTSLHMYAAVVQATFIILISHSLYRRLAHRVSQQVIFVVIAAGLQPTACRLWFVYFSCGDRFFAHTFFFCFALPFSFSLSLPFARSFLLSFSVFLQNQCVTLSFHVSFGFAVFLWPIKLNSNMVDKSETH